MIVNLPTIQKKKVTGSPGFQHLLSLVENNGQKLKNSVTVVERALISRLKTGDPIAFSSIFSAYYKDLVVFAFRFTKDVSSAEEIVQDTFVKLWEECGSVNINVSIKSYLLKTIQNKYIDWCRHEKIRQIHQNFIIEETLQYVADTDNYVLQSELQDQIDNALSLLPEEISSTFRLNRFKGLKYSEIADLLGVSVRTIEVRIGKALNMLRDHLKDYLPFALVLLDIFIANI